MALQVIGAGLGRTGTLSLKLALEHLGFGPCYHMTEVMAGARRNTPLWVAAAEGRPDWDAIFAGYGSTTDYPGCTYWRELADHYPQAKVVLSTRDAGKWFDSVSQTIFSPQMRTTVDATPLAPMFDRAVHGVFGDRIADRAYMTEWFERRNEEVAQALPPERLLVHSAADGWEPLCAFLGVPVPAEPYPRINSRDEFGSGVSEGGTSLPEDPDELERAARRYIEELRTKAFAAA